MSNPTFQTNIDIDEPLLDLELYGGSNVAVWEHNCLTERRRISRLRVCLVIGFWLVAVLIGTVLAIVISSGKEPAVTDRMKLRGAMNMEDSTNTASTKTVSIQQTVMVNIVATLCLFLRALRRFQRLRRPLQCI